MMGMVRTIRIIGECDKKGWTESKKENQQRTSRKTPIEVEAIHADRPGIVQVSYSLVRVCFIEYIIYQTTTLSHFPL